MRADSFLPSTSVRSFQTSQKNQGSCRLGVDLLVMLGQCQTTAIEGNKTRWNRNVKDGLGANCLQRVEGGDGGAQNWVTFSRSFPPINSKPLHLCPTFYFHSSFQLSFISLPVKYLLSALLLGLVLGAKARVGVGGK